MSQMWLKYAEVTLPSDKVYFGVKVKRNPKSRFDTAVKRPDGIRCRGHSSPSLRITVRELGETWQNAPKRNIAWNPSATAAFSSNHSIEGGVM